MLTQDFVETGVSRGARTREYRREVRNDSSRTHRRVPASAADPALVQSAPITLAIRSIRTEVEVGPEHGRPERCVIGVDRVITVPIEDLDDEPVGHLDEVTRAPLDMALRFALDIVY